MNVESAILAPAVHIGVGIDTARHGHRASFLSEGKLPVARPLTVTENSVGYQNLRQRFEVLAQKYRQAHFHVHLDAAGQYATNLELFLRSLPFPITLSVGEPKRNKDYHKAFFPKQSSDDTESQAMARFGVVERPVESPVVNPELYLLRETISRLEAQVRDTTRATNRLHNLLARVFPEFAGIVGDIASATVIQLLKKYPSPKRIVAAGLNNLKKIPYLRDAKAELVFAAAQQTVGTLTGELAEQLLRELVDALDHCRMAQERLEKLVKQAYQNLPAAGHTQVATIIGIGDLTAAVLVSKMINIGRFLTPEHLVGYFGVFPEKNSSGVDREGNEIVPGSMSMSTKGSDIVRRYLWNAANSALQHNPAVKALYKRLRANKVRHDVSVGHCMRKLLHLVHAVWSSDTPFDPQHYPWENPGQPKSVTPEPTSDQNPVSEPSVAEVTPQTQPQPTETAASHNRELSPKTKVVNTANPTLDQQPPPVNQRPASRSVDFRFLREQISFQQVLQHLGLLDTLKSSRGELRGPCPIHNGSRSSLAFSVNLKKNVFSCHTRECKKAGNVLDFWAAYHHLDIHEAAIHLANTFHIPLTGNTEKRSP